MRKLVNALALAPLLTGCVSARATMLGTGAPQPPVAEDQVRVFLADDPVPEDCERYALITLAGDAQMTSQAQLISAARRRAGKVGANAVQLGVTKEPGTGRQVARAVLGLSADRKSEMVAFRCP